MREPSYKARRLAKMLTEWLREHYASRGDKLGTVQVQPQEIYPATGWYRTSPNADCLRWEATVRMGGRPMGGVESWDTMTDCIRFGMKIRPATGPGSRPFCDFEASSKGPDRWETPVKRARADSRDA